MSDSAAHLPGNQPSASAAVASVLIDIEPMGDLSGFVIDDLTPDEEDEFFAILGDA